MSDHLQLQLRDLGDQISKIVSNHSRIRGVAEEDAVGRVPGADGLGDQVSGKLFDDRAEIRPDTVDSDIAEVEKMLQQWLGARGRDA